jgi:hypothetical protein
MQAHRVSGLGRLAWAFSRRARLATVETRAPQRPAANVPCPTAPSGQRAPHRAQRPTCTLQQGTTLPSPLPGAFAQVQRRVSDGVTRPRPTYGYNRFYN